MSVLSIELICGDITILLAFIYIVIANSPLSQVKSPIELATCPNKFY